MIGTANTQSSADEDQPRLYQARPLRRTLDHDLAILRVEGFYPEYALPLANDSEIIPNQLVNCFEYGTTEVAGGHINLSPANRLGYVTRLRDLTEQFGPAGDHMLELSFPALRGASGSPVMLWHRPFRVWGVVKANVARGLLPAQVERVFDEGGQVEEEIRFLLPQALAVHVMHVRRLLDEAVAE